MSGMRCCGAMPGSCFCGVENFSSLPPPTKKVDVTVLAHVTAKAHCKAEGLRVKEWVSELILREVHRPTPVTQGKLLEQLPTDEDPSIWRRPPFWAKA